MAVVHYVTAETPLPGGEKIVRGKLTLGAYAAGGAALNLANYLKSSGIPSVFVGGVSNATNVAFGCQANVVSAEDITILCTVGGLGAAEPGYFLNAGFELTAQNVEFMAIGPAF